MAVGCTGKLTTLVKILSCLFGFAPLPLLNKCPDFFFFVAAIG